jgi:3-oxoacyl-[acyl-carrier protein] reductase
MVMKEKTAVIMGGGGIGEATAKVLAKKGMNVVIASRTANQAKIDADEMLKGCLAIKADARNEGDVLRLISQTTDRFPSIDILVNTVGVFLKKPIEDVSFKEWDNVFHTNIRGQFLSIKGFLPYIQKGTIINISSCSGLYGFPLSSVYSASKFAVIGLTKSLSKELESRNIRLYAICPGAVDTPMFRKESPDYPKWKLIKPERIAKKIVRLCKPNCTLKSGSVIEVYGLNELYGLRKWTW